MCMLLVLTLVLISLKVVYVTKHIQENTTDLTWTLWRQFFSSPGTIANVWTKWSAGLKLSGQGKPKLFIFTKRSGQKYFMVNSKDPETVLFHFQRLCRALAKETYRIYEDVSSEMLIISALLGKFSCKRQPLKTYLQYCF